MKKYSDQHEWIMVNGTTGIVGISDYAQSQLGDVVFTELPSIGKELAKGTEAAVVESVKAASEVYTPVSGRLQRLIRIWKQLRISSTAPLKPKDGFSK